MFFAGERLCIFELAARFQGNGNRFRIVQLAVFTARTVEGDPFRLVSGVTRWDILVGNKPVPFFQYLTDARCAPKESQRPTVMLPPRFPSFLWSTGECDKMWVGLIGGRHILSEQASQIRQLVTRTESVFDAHAYYPYCLSS